jgi:uroporphyrinogen-III synthase
MKRFKVPEGLKYFCQSEAVAFYAKICCLQKRKIYVGPKDFADLSPLIKKYKDEKFLYLPQTKMLMQQSP